MTPTELCSLAEKINSAVPGLVPPMKCHGYESSVDVFNGDHGYRPSQLKNAAAMMLGWVEAARRKIGNELDRMSFADGRNADMDRVQAMFITLSEYHDTLQAFLTTQLPEAT